MKFFRDCCGCFGSTKKKDRTKEKEKKSATERATSSSTSVSFFSDEEENSNSLELSVREKKHYLFIDIVSLITLQEIEETRAIEFGLNKQLIELISKVVDHYGRDCIEPGILVAENEQSRIDNERDHKEFTRTDVLYCLNSDENYVYLLQKAPFISLPTNDKYEPVFESRKVDELFEDRISDNCTVFSMSKTLIDTAKSHGCKAVKLAAAGELAEEDIKKWELLSDIYDDPDLFVDVDGTLLNRELTILNGETCIYSPVKDFLYRSKGRLHALTSRTNPMFQIKDLKNDVVNVISHINSLREALKVTRSAVFQNALNNSNIEAYNQKNIVSTIRYDQEECEKRCANLEGFIVKLKSVLNNIKEELEISDDEIKSQNFKEMFDDMQGAFNEKNKDSHEFLILHNLSRLEEKKDQIEIDVYSGYKKKENHYEMCYRAHKATVYGGLSLNAIKTAYGEFSIDLIVENESYVNTSRTGLLKIDAIIDFIKKQPVESRPKLVALIDNSEFEIGAAKNEIEQLAKMDVILVPIYVYEEGEIPRSVIDYYDDLFASKDVAVTLGM